MPAPNVELSDSFSSMINHTWPTFVAAVVGAAVAGVAVGAIVAGAVVGELLVAGVAEAAAEWVGVGADVDVTGTAGDGPIDAPP